MKKIILLIVVLLVLFGVYYFSSTRDKQVTSSIMEAEISYGEKCKQSNFYNITDQNHLLVSQAKQRFISSSNISQSYFDTHFKFECGAMAENGDHAIFRFTVGEYNSELHLIKFAGSTSETDSSWVGFDEIKNVLDKETALRKLKSCLRADPQNIRVNLNPDIFFIYGMSGYNEATIDLETGRCQKGDTRANV